MLIIDLNQLQLRDLHIILIFRRLFGEKVVFIL